MSAIFRPWRAKMRENKITDNRSAYRDKFVSDTLLESLREAKESLFTYATESIGKSWPESLSENNNKPTVFISYAHDGEGEANTNCKWIRKNLMKPLQALGYNTLLDEDNLAAGQEIETYEKRIYPATFVIVIIDETYIGKLSNQKSGAYYEMQCIKEKIKKRSTQETIIPILKSDNFDILPTELEKIFTIKSSDLYSNFFFIAHSLYQTKPGSDEFQALKAIHEKFNKKIKYFDKLPTGSKSIEEIVGHYSERERTKNERRDKILNSSKSLEQTTEELPPIIPPSIEDVNEQLFLAIKKGDAGKVKELLEEKGANSNYRDGTNSTPLHVSSENNQEKITTLLIGKQADVNARNDYGYTPLHEAAMRGNSEITKMLVDYNAKMDCTDNFGNTPLHLAIQNGHRDAAAALVDSGADLAAKDQYGNTPINLIDEKKHPNLSSLKSRMEKPINSVKEQSVRLEEINLRRLQNDQETILIEIQKMLRKEFQENFSELLKQKEEQLQKLREQERASLLKISKIESENQEMKEKIDAMLAENKRFNEKLDKLIETNKRNEELITSRQRKILKTEKELRETQKMLDKSKMEAESNKNKADEELKLLNQELERTKVEKESAATETKDFYETRISKLEEKIKRKQEEIERHNSKVGELEISLKKTNDEIEQLKKTTAEEIESLKSDIEKSKDQREERTKKIEELQEEINNLKKYGTESENELKKLKSKEEKLLKQDAEQSDRIEKMEEMLDSLSNESDRNKKEKSQWEEERKSIMEQSRSELEKQKSSYEQQLKAEKEALDKEIEQKKIELLKKKKKIKNIKKEKKLIEENNVKELKKQQSSYEQQLKTEKDALNKKIEKKQNKVAKKNEEIETLEKEKQKITQLNNDILEKQKSTYEQQLKTEKEAFTEEIRQEKTKSSEKSNKIDSLEKENEALKRKIQEMEEERIRNSKEEKRENQKESYAPALESREKTPKKSTKEEENLKQTSQSPEAKTETIDPTKEPPVTQTNLEAEVLFDSGIDLENIDPEENSFLKEAIDEEIKREKIELPEEFKVTDESERERRELQRKSRELEKERIKTSREEALKNRKNPRQNVSESEKKRANEEFLRAAKEGNSEQVTQALKTGMIDSAQESAISETSVKRGDINLLKALIAGGIDLEIRDPDGNTLLQIAILNGHIKIFTYLIENGSKVNVRNRLDESPLEQILCRYPKSLFKIKICLIAMLIKYNADLNAKNGTTTLANFVISGDDFFDIVLFSFLINAGADVNLLSDNFGDDLLPRLSLLDFAARAGNYEACELLLSLESFSPPLENIAANHPIEYAASKGHKRIVTLLVQSKKIPYDEGEKQVFEALYDISKGDSSLAKELLQQEKISITFKLVRLNGHFNLIMLSVQGNCFDLIEYLLEQGMDINHKEIKKGKTALHVAVEMESQEKSEQMVLFLLKKNADPNLVNLKNRPPLQYAAERGNWKVCEILIQNGAQETPEYHKAAFFRAIQEEDFTKLELHAKALGTFKLTKKRGITPLHLAAKEGKLEICKFLLSKDKTLANELTEYDYTPYQEAYVQDHKAVMELLESHTNLYNIDEQRIIKAIAQNNLEEVKAILTKTGLNRKNIDGDTFLHLYARRKDPEMCGYLIKEIKVCTNIKNNAGETPYQIAKKLATTGIFSNTEKTEEQVLEEFSTEHNCKVM